MKQRGWFGGKGGGGGGLRGGFDEGTTDLPGGLEDVVPEVPEDCVLVLEGGGGEEVAFRVLWHHHLLEGADHLSALVGRGLQVGRGEGEGEGEEGDYQSPGGRVVALEPKMRAHQGRLWGVFILIGMSSHLEVEDQEVGDHEERVQACVAVLGLELHGFLLQSRSSRVFWRGF